MNVGALSPAGNFATVTSLTPPRAEPIPAPPIAAPIPPVAPEKPYINPAFADIASRAAVTPNVPVAATDAELYGDSGLLIQSYGAVALLSGPLNRPPVYQQQIPPAVPPVEPI